MADGDEIGSMRENRSGCGRKRRERIQRKRRQGVNMLLLPVIRSRVVGFYLLEKWKWRAGIDSEFKESRAVNAPRQREKFLNRTKTSNSS